MNLYRVAGLVDLVADGVLGSTHASAGRGVAVLGNVLVGLLRSTGQALVDRVRDRVGGVPGVEVSNSVDEG